MALAFVRNPLDRRANERADAAWLAAQLAHPAARLVQLAGDAALLDGSQLVTRIDPAHPIDLASSLFLGLDAEGAPWFAREAPAAVVATAKRHPSLMPGASAPASAADGVLELRDLRSLAMAATLPPEQLGLLAQARALLSWHTRHRFCSACGAPSSLAEAGYRRHCAGCNTDHFPRTDPVAIIAVRHQDRVLLCHQHGWRPGMYSALAGFLEPGETLEDAARREVFEEAGIHVGAVRYVASQPWPFPGSLMIGLLGEALSTDIRIDEKELKDARWFSAAELRTMIDHTHPENLFAANPMAIAHHLIRTAIGDI
jgi:NAD+ diphosphatase